MKAESSALSATADQSTGASALWRQATDVAHLCKEIVLKTVVEIAGRRYVRVEGWMSIAVAHGCIASIKLVEKVPGEGVRAVAEVRRISDQAVLAEAEGFVGQDEPDWYGGTVTRYNKRTRQEEPKTVEKRSDHAIRAMAQTRAISRALRAGFSHVVVLIDEKLSTVPAEEIASTEDHEPEDRPTSRERVPPAAEEKEAKPIGEVLGKPPAAAETTVPRDGEVALRAQFEGGKWEKVKIHFGADKDKTLGELPQKKLGWWCNDWQPKPFGNKPIKEEDLLLRAALDVARVEGLMGLKE